MLSSVNKFNIQSALSSKIMHTRGVVKIFKQGSFRSQRKGNFRPTICDRSMFLSRLEEETKSISVYLVFTLKKRLAVRARKALRSDA